MRPIFWPGLSVTSAPSSRTLVPRRSVTLEKRIMGGLPDGGQKGRIVYAADHREEHGACRRGIMRAPHAFPPSVDFDVVVVGAGAAGMMCAAVAGSRGRRVLLVD